MNTQTNLEHFADSIDGLSRMPFHNRLCYYNPDTQRYCYALYNSTTNNLTTGYEFNSGENLDIILDQSA